MEENKKKELKEEELEDVNGGIFILLNNKPKSTSIKKDPKLLNDGLMVNDSDTNTGIL